MKDVEEYPLRAPPKEKVFRVSFDDTTSVVVPGHTVLTFTVNRFRWLPQSRKIAKVANFQATWVQTRTLTAVKVAYLNPESTYRHQGCRTKE